MFPEIGIDGIEYDKEMKLILLSDNVFIFKDERENILRATNVLNITYVVAIFSVILIISLIAFVTTRTFGSITKAIEVLEGLTQGDSSQEMPERKGIFVSETDEEISFKLKLTGDLKDVRFVHYNIHPSFGRYSTYRSRSRRRSFATPVFKTYAEGWRTGKVTITFYDGTQVVKEGVLIQ